MELLNLYKDLCENIRWYDAYCSTGKKANGKMFYLINTNYRNLFGFEKGYRVLKNVENIDRDKWVHKKSGQEIEKQHTVNMLNSKIFSRRDNKYYRNKKGLAFGDMMDHEFQKEERWIIEYLTILNGYFANIPNYIKIRSNQMIKIMEERGIEKTQYINLLEDFIKKCDIGEMEIYKHDYLYYDTFYKNFEDIDFLDVYLKSSEEEKEELKRYVLNQPKNYKIKKQETCTISYKYKETGSYVKSTVIDNAKIQYYTLTLLNESYKNYEEFFEAVILKYSEIYTKINKNRILKFIKEHQDVYKLIYEEVFGIVQYSLNFREDKEVEETEVNLDKKIDDTDINSVEEYNKVSTVLKKLAKTNSNYRCELEEFYDCQYFTSKESHRNYVEVHHLIPRAVGNDFYNSIEVVENYVVLCPHCHRLLHHGEDVERKPALHNLYIKRKEALSKKGLDIKEKKLKEYYLIDM